SSPIDLLDVLLPASDSGNRPMAWKAIRKISLLGFRYRPGLLSVVSWIHRGAGNRTAFPSVDSRGSNETTNRALAISIRTPVVGQCGRNNSRLLPKRPYRADAADALVRTQVSSEDLLVAAAVWKRDHRLDSLFEIPLRGRCC